MIDFKCPHCSNRLRVNDSAGGKTGKCKQCGKSITIPETADEPVEPQQDEEDEVEEAEEADEDYLPPPKPRRPKTKTEKKTQSSGSSFLIIGAVVGGVCVLVLGVVFGVWFSSSGKLVPSADGGKPDVAELAKAKADVEAAKAELAKVQAETQLKERKCVVSGELFATTQSGDVKKAAGLSVRLLPVTAEFRNRLTQLVKQFDDASEERDAADKVWKAKNPEPPDLLSSKHLEWYEAQDKDVYRPYFARNKVVSEDAEGLFAKISQETTTNSEGKFRAEVEVGPYILLSGIFSMPFDKLVWCKAIKAQGSEIALSLNQETAVKGQLIGDKAFNPGMYNILKEILNQTGR